MNNEEASESHLPVNYPNKIRYFRKKAKLTQEDLAKTAGISQTKIHRMEATDAVIRLEDARAVSKALGKKLHQVFPSVPVGADTPAFEFKRRVPGIDLDPTHYYLDVTLKGGANRTLALDSDTYYETIEFLLDMEVEDLECPEFIFHEIKTQDGIVLLNSRMVRTFKFRFEPIADPEPESDLSPEDLFLQQDFLGHAVTVYSGTPTPTLMHTMSDMMPRAGFPLEEGVEVEVSEVGTSMFYFELMHGMSMAFVSATNLDGDQWVFPTDDIEMVFFPEGLLSLLPLEEEDGD